MGLNVASMPCSSNTQTPHRNAESIKMQVDPENDDLVGRPTVASHHAPTEPSASGARKHHSQGLEPPRGFQGRILTTTRQEGRDSGSGSKWALARPTPSAPASEPRDWESPHYEPQSPIQQASRVSDSSCQSSLPEELPLNICHLPTLTSLDVLSLRPYSKLRVAVMIRAIALDAERWGEQCFHLVPPKLLEAWAKNKSESSVAYLRKQFHPGHDSGRTPRMVCIIPPNTDTPEALAICSIASSHCDIILLGESMALESLRKLIFSVFRTVFPKTFPWNRFLTFLINIRKAGRTAADYGIVLVGVLRQCLTDSGGPESGLQSIFRDRWGQRTVSEHVNIHETRRGVLEALQDAIPPSHEANTSEVGPSSDWPAAMTTTPQEEIARSESIETTPSVASRSWMSDSDCTWQPGSVYSDAEESQDGYRQPKKHKHGSDPTQPVPPVHPDQKTNSVASQNRSIWNRGQASSSIDNTSEKQCRKPCRQSDFETVLESDFSDDYIDTENVPLALPTQDNLRDLCNLSAVLERMKAIDMNDEEDIQRRVTAGLTPSQRRVATLSQEDESRVISLFEKLDSPWSGPPYGLPLAQYKARILARNCHKPSQIYARRW